MDTKIGSLGLLAGMAILLAGCEVECEFTKKSFDEHAKHPVIEECHAEIVLCESNECTPDLKIKCGGHRVYHGPYTVSILNGIIKYTATNWDGKGDVPFVRTEAPVSSLTALSEEADEKGHAAGYCRYERLLPLLR